MSRTLLLRMDPTASEASWQLIENGQLVGSLHQGALADAYRDARGAPVVVLVPTEEVFITSAALPGKNRKKLLKAVPYVVEDQLVDEIDDLHFALSQQAIHGQYLVAAVENRLMQYWDTALRAAHLYTEVLVPDILTLLDASDSWTVLLEPERALVRSPLGMFASDIENLPLMLNNLYLNAGEDKPAEVTLYDCSKVNHAASLQESTPDIDYHAVDCPDGVFGVFARHFDVRHTVNLMQGEYNRQEGMIKHFKPWLPAASLFALWLSWQLIVSIVELIDLGASSEQLSKQMRDVHKLAFPGTKPPSPGYERSDMQARLNKLQEKQGKASGSLQEMLAKTAPVFKNVSGVEINALRYNNGRLDVELTIQQSSDLEPLKKKLEEQTGWEIKSQASTVKGVTKVRLNIVSTS